MGDATEVELGEQERADALARSAAESIDMALASTAGRRERLEEFVHDLAELVALRTRPAFKALSAKMDREEELYERRVEELEAHRNRPSRTGRALEAFVRAGRLRGDIAARHLVDNGVVADPFQGRRIIEFLVHSGRLRWEGEHIEPTAEGRREAARASEEHQREDRHHEPEEREASGDGEGRAQGAAQRHLFDTAL